MSAATEVVVKPNDIVFAKVSPALHFNEDQSLCHVVLDPMSCADRNIDSLAGRDTDLFIVESDFRDARHDEPMFRTLRMFLITKPLARQHLNSLYLKQISFIEHFVSAPRAPIKLSRFITGVVQ